jgi:hypothetical protein
VFDGWEYSKMIFWKIFYIIVIISKLNIEGQQCGMKDSKCLKVFELRYFSTIFENY